MPLAPWMRRDDKRRLPQDSLSALAVQHFTEGLDDTSRPLDLKPGFGRIVRNVHWRQIQLEKRPGSGQIGQELPGPIQWVGSYNNLESGTHKFMCIADDSLFYLDQADTTGHATGTWKGAVSDDPMGLVADVCSSGTEKCSVEQYLNMLWISDGVTAYRYTEDPVPALQPWSFADADAMPAPVQSAPTAGGALTVDSDYNCKVSYRDPLVGDETNGSPVGAPDQTTAGANLQIPVSYGPDPNWTPNYSEVLVYRCKADSTSGPWFYEETISGVVDLDVNPILFTLDVADSALGDQTVPENHNAVTPAKYILLFDDSFVMWGYPDERSQVRYSLVGEPWSWPSLSLLQVNKKDGQELTACKIGVHQVIAIKDRSTHILTRNESFDFVREEVPQFWGSTAPRGVVAIETFLYGLDQKNTWLFDTNHFTPTGARIQGVLELVRSAGAIAQSHAVAAKSKYGNWLMLWVKTDGALDDCDSILVLDTRSNGWAIWDGMPARVSASLPNPTTKAELIWAGTSEGVVFTFEEDLEGNRYWSDYTGEPIEAEWMSGPLGLEIDEAGRFSYRQWVKMTLALNRHETGKVEPVQFKLFTELDDLDGGVPSATIEHTPGTTNAFEIVDKWIPQTITSQFVFVLIQALEADQDLRLTGLSVLAGHRGHHRIAS